MFKYMTEYKEKRTSEDHSFIAVSVCHYEWCHIHSLSACSSVSFIIFSGGIAEF